MKLFGRSWKRKLRRIFDLIQRDGVAVFIGKVAALLRDTYFRKYGRWIALYDTLDDTARRSIEADIARLPSQPVFSIVMPVSGDDAALLAATIRSVRAQLYPRWELYLTAGHSAMESLAGTLEPLTDEDGRIRLVRTADDATAWADRVDAALKHGSGEFVALLDPGDTLSEHALYWITEELAAHPDADLIFSDEDKINGEASRSDPWFKPDWNPALMLSCNAFGRLGVFRRSLVDRVGGLRAGFDGAEEYELVLRCARSSEPRRIRHIARVLYHRRGDVRDEPASIAGGEGRCRAVAEHLAAQNIAATVSRGNYGIQVSYPLPTPHPRVSILIATTARPDLLGPCLQSLFARTSYDNWEVILLVNERIRQSPQQDALLQDAGKRPNVRVVEYPDRPFNYSWVNNLGAAHASGDVLCFLNDDTEVVTADWLEQLVARVSLPQVGAAGATLYYPDDSIQHAGVILGLRGIAGHACNGEPRGSHGYFGRACLEQDVSGVTAACVAIRAGLFRTLGGFDEAMPLAYNDVDLCLRLRAAGWRIIWTPAVELVHYESASLGSHDMGARAAQYAHDIALMRQRWAKSLDADPFYNCNLSLERGHRLAFPPRAPVAHDALDVR